MLEYWENLEFKTPYTPGVWKIIKSGGGLFARHLCVIEKKLRAYFIKPASLKYFIAPGWIGAERPSNMLSLVRT